MRMLQLLFFIDQKLILPVSVQVCVCGTHVYCIIVLWYDHVLLINHDVIDDYIDTISTVILIWSWRWLLLYRLDTRTVLMYGRYLIRRLKLVKGLDQDHLGLCSKLDGMVCLSVCLLCCIYHQILWLLYGWWSITLLVCILFCSGPVAVKKLNVSNPTEQQMQAFKNEVAVLL